MSQGESDFCWDSVACGIDWVSRSRDYVLVGIVQLYQARIRKELRKSLSGEPHF